MNFWKRLRRSQFSLQQGQAHRVIFYYQGEDPTFLEDAFVVVYRNGVVEVEHRTEHVSTHAQNVEILWKNRPAALGKKTNATLALVKSDISQ